VNIRRPGLDSLLKERFEVHSAREIMLARWEFAIGLWTHVP